MLENDKPVNLGGVIEGFPKLPSVGYEAGEDTPVDISVNDMFNSLPVEGQKGRPSIPVSSFYTGPRYDVSFPGMDMEEVAGQNQSAWNKWGNALVKMTGVAGTTLVSGTVGLVYGIGASIQNGRFSSLYDNEVTRKMDDIDKYLNDALPNYYTYQEQDAEWYSPNNLLTANFWADKVLKNLGFSAGALLGGIGWSAAFRATGIINKLVKAGRALEMIEATEKAMTAVPKVQKYAALQNTLASLSKKYLSPVASPILKSSDRILTSAMATFGEASLESLHNLNEYRTKLIEDYKDKNGVAPTGTDLDEINNYADKVGNFTWGGNTLLLTATNYIMLPKILGSSRKADKLFLNDIVKDKTGKSVTPPKTLLSRIKGVAPLLFSPNESFEEASQYAIQIGTKDYFDRAYKNKDDVTDFLSNLTGVMKGTFDEGVEKTFGTKEGIENVIIGGISGALQQGIGRVISKEGQVKDRNTAIALAILNNSSLADKLKNEVAYIARGINSQSLRQEAIAENDILSEKDYELDYTMSYILPRIKYGKVESIAEEIEGFRNQANTEEGFQELKNEGVISPTESKEQFLSRLAKVEKIASNSNKLYKQIQDKYSEVRDNEGNRIFTDSVIDKMVYAAAKIEDYDERIPLVSQDLLAAGIDVQSVVKAVIESNEGKKQITGKKPVKEAIEKIKELNSINEDQLVQDLRDVVELSLRRKQYLDEYNDIKRNPASHEDIIRPIIGSPIATTQEGKQEALEENRKYIIPSTAAEVKKIPNEDQWEVTSRVTEPKIYNTKEEAEKREVEINSELADTEEITVLRFNRDNTVFIEDKTGDKYNIPLSRLVGYEKVLTEQEQLQRFTEDFKKEQSDIEKESGTIETNSNPEDIEYLSPEDKRKTADQLYSSTTSPSEERAVLKPHHITAITFLNNAKNLKNFSKFKVILVTPNQEKSLGLEGLSDLSANGSGLTKDKYTDIDEGLVFAVYVAQEKDGLYYIDENGKLLGKVGETTDLNSVVFSTMPSTSLTWGDNKTPRYREAEKEAAESQSKLWREKRKLLFNAPSGSYSVFDFSISRGIPIITDSNTRNAVGNNLVPESKIANENLIVIPTTGTVLFKGSLLKYPNGRPVLLYKDTLQFINNHTFNKKQATTIYKVIEALSNDINEQKKNKVKNIKIDRKYTTFLQNVLYWKDSANTKNNQIYINTVTAQLILGEEKYDLTNINSSIIGQLEKTYHAVNNKTLEDLSKSFIEYYIENDELKTRKWKNYQSYLLASKLPDGKIRSNDDIPLTTSVDTPSETIPYNYKQKYSTLSELLPQVQVSKKEEQPQKEKGKIEQEQLDTNKYILDNSTVNTYVSPSGKKIQFVASGVDDIRVLGTEDLPEVLSLLTSKLGSDEAAKTNIKNTLKLSIAEQLPDIKVEEKPSIPANRTYKGIFIIESDIKTATGEPGAAQFDRKNNIIKINTSLLKEKFDKKAWKASRQQKDKTFSKQLDENAFTTYEEFEKFVIEHEYQHSLLSYEQFGTNQTLGKYEDEINKRALQAIEAERTPAKIEVHSSINLKDLANTPPPPNSEYSRVSSENVGRMTPAELELFKEWHKKNVPGIPYEVLENIILTYDNQKAWGVFENGVAKFFKLAKKGTEYHEIFEAIWASFLTKEQQQVVLEEERNKPGSFKDRESGKIIKYDEATDYQLKEKIADDFADFRLGKIKVKSLSDKIVSFFRSIIEFFKSFVQKPSVKEDLFKAIDSGEFKNLVIPNQSIAPQYRRVEGLSEKQTNEFVQDISARFFQIVFGTNTSLWNPELISSNEIFNQIKQQYLDKGTAQKSRMEVIGQETFDQLIDRTKDFLRTLKIEFDEDSQILTINTEGIDNRLYAPEPFSTNWKKTSSFPIKILLATLPVTTSSNQESLSLMGLPDVKVSDEANGFLLMNFSRTFATVLNTLNNTTDIQLFTDKLKELAVQDSNYVRLFTRLGGSREEGVINYDQFDDNDWRLFINFYQTFSKQKPAAFIQYINEGEIYTSSADIDSVVNKEKNKWVENMKNLSKKKDSIIFYNKPTKTYQVRKIDDLSVKTPQDQVKFLEKLGIEFSMGVYNKLKSYQKDKFSKSVSSIYNVLNKTKDLISVTGKTLQISGPLTTLAELLVNVTNPNQELSYFGLDKTRRQLHSENNVASIFENDFNSSDTLDELLEKRPELKNDFSQNSVVLKKGGLYFNEDGERIKSLKVGYIQGIKNIDENKETDASKLTPGNRLTLEINQNINGQYYILLPADSSTEWMMSLDNNISYNDIATEEAWEEIYKIFKNYLKDDINLAKNKSSLKNIGNRSQKLRFFNDILSEELLEKAEKIINNNGDVDTFVGENEEQINKSVKEYIQADVNNTISILKETHQITSVSENSFAFINIDSNFIKDEKLDNSNLSEKEVNDIITFTNVNYIINNIEFHKLLFGDPYQYAIKNNQLDEVKRIKSFLSPRRTTFDTIEYNNYLNTRYNTVGEVELEEKDPGYRIHKSYLNVVSVSDIEITGSTSQLKNIPDTIKSSYLDVNEADAFSLLIDGAYRELKLKNGQWSDIAEEWYQYQMAYTRQNIPGYEYTSKTLEKQDIKLLSKPEPKYVIEVIKPIVSGVGKNNNGDLITVLHKMSQMPIFYSAVEGTNMEQLYLKMLKEKKDYVVFESAEKVGTDNLHSLYTENGEFNKEEFNNSKEVPWKVYGIQVENSYDRPKEQTRGTQITKIVSMDMFDNGVPISKTANDEYKKNRELLDTIHRNAYKNLLESLNIEDLDGNFKINDNTNIAEILRNQLLSREASENLKDILQLDENGEFLISFEASSSYVQIRDILYSLIDKAILSPKVSGGSYVQVPVTLWENSKEGRKVVEINGKKVFTDSTLKFYTKEEPWCEIMLPAWFKDKLSKGKYKTDQDILNYLNKTQEGRNILKGVGFRIPTQAMSSIENFRVKGFTPSYMGNTVIVPSEITKKAGSDFDIDKLNLYLKSIYVDEKGDIRLVKYKGSENETKEFYSKLFDKKLENSKIKKNEILEALQILHYGLEDDKKLIEKYADILNDIVDKSDDLSVKEEELLSKIEKLSDEQIQSKLKDEFVKSMYKKALENEYYESLEKLLSLPENFERLISPVEDGGLKKLSEKLDKLKGIDETIIKNRILNRNFMSYLRHAFITGKKWVGIGAVNITGHSLAQKTELYIDTDKFQNLSDFDRKWLKDGYVVLPHNKTADGKVSMSGKLTADKKEYISDRLSGYITSFVDVAKDPYILKIIKSDLAIGTFMFLERIGAGETAALFMNQPIIDEYLSYLSSIDARGLYNADNLKYIRSKFLSTEKLKESAKIDISKFENNIEEYNKRKLTDAENAIQLQILDEFLKYAKMAQYSFKLTQASNYDTMTLRSKDQLIRKQFLTDNAREKTIFSSVDNILNNSHIQLQSYILNDLAEAFGEILKLDRYDIRSENINPVLRQFYEREFISNEEYDRISNRVISSFIDFIAQTNSSINTDIKNLIVGISSEIPAQLALAKEKYPQFRIINELQIVSTDRNQENRTNSIKLQANIKEAYDENLYTEMMRELRDFPSTNSLYKNIVTLSFLQGTYHSPISIANIIPVEDRAAVLTPIINKLTSNSVFSDISAFQRNNWKDTEVFKTVTPKFFTNDNQLIGEDQFGNEIFLYTSPAFPNIPSINIESKDRKILQLNEKYHSFDISSDFILVPRVVKDYKTGERVDIKTGKTVTNAQFAISKAKGDLSLKDVYGYKKVKYITGEPLTTTDKDGNKIYIYKLINLWGDGIFASEYYLTPKPSVLDNGTAKINQEIPDSDIIKYYSPSSIIETSIISDINDAIFEAKNKGREIVKPVSEVNIQEETPREFIMRMKEMGMFNSLGDVYSPHIDLEMPTKEINKALNDIERYNFGTVPAKKLMEKMENMRKIGYINLIAGSGNMVVRTREPIPSIEDSSNSDIPCS